MSAIVGICFLDGRPVESALFEQMMASLAHRGPDGTSTWYNAQKSIGLGHLLLRTTRESDSKVLTDEKIGLTLTADARLDNRDELIAALGSSNHSLPREASDDELILRAFEKWGDRCPEKLLGDFAFAVWDERKQTLFCARDHLGVKPFYYYWSPALFAFATEIKALLCLPEIPRRVNENRVADYLVSVHEEQRETLFENIFRLPAGHSLTVNRGASQRDARRYWTLNPQGNGNGRFNGGRLQSDADYVATFRELFTEAVRCRLRSDGKAVATTLSGGLDSSSITCVARDILAKSDEPLHTFSAIYDEVPECDERTYIHHVLAQGNLTSHFVHPDRLGPLTQWEEHSAYLDEPLWIPQMVILWLIYQKVKEEKIRVLLDGYGGDSVVSHGVARLTELAHAGRWVSFVKEATAFSKRGGRSFRTLVRNRGLAPFAPESLRRIWKTLKMSNGGNRLAAVGNTPLREDFSRRIRLEERLVMLLGERLRRPRSARRAHWIDLTSGIYPWMLEMGDRAAGLFGIERRRPFYDRRVVEFCLALPSAQKMGGGWTRLILRRSLAGIVPDEVRWRVGKADHSSNFHRGLLKYNRHLLESAIFRNLEQIAEYVCMDSLRRMYDRYLAHGDHEDGFTLWRVAMMALWLRRVTHGTA